MKIRDIDVIILIVNSLSILVLLLFLLQSLPASPYSGGPGNVILRIPMEGTYSNGNAYDTTYNLGFTMLIILVGIIFFTQIYLNIRIVQKYLKIGTVEDNKSGA